jgi:hypothetical protein
MSRPIGVRLSVWIEAIRSDLHQAAAASPGLSLTLDEVLNLTAILGEAADAARLLELRAAAAPPLEPPANVVQFVRQPKPPTDGGDAA